MNNIRSALYENIIKKASEYEDGTMGITQCVEKYCEECNLDSNLAEQALEYFYKKEALAAGIPLSVIEGKTKLTDHFSEDYINWKCNRKNDKIEI